MSSSSSSSARATSRRAPPSRCSAARSGGARSGRAWPPPPRRRRVAAAGDGPLRLPRPHQEGPPRRHEAGARSTSSRTIEIKSAETIQGDTTLTWDMTVLGWDVRYRRSSCRPTRAPTPLWFLSTPNASKARAMLLNGAVRKGERLVPAGTLDLFMRCTFPVPNACVKATERFEAAYPTIKELALVGTPGSKAVKQAWQQLLPLAVKAIQENNAELDKEATDVFIWCLTQSPESYKLWDKLHAENTQATIYCNSHVLNSSILNCSMMIAILHRTIKSWIGN